jgi:hypothetical protein
VFERIENKRHVELLNILHSMSKEISSLKMEMRDLKKGRNVAVML